MNKDNDNPWSPRKVAEAHGYFSNLDEASSHHDIFASFIKDKDDASICDMGCGNGRILNNLDNYSKYLGIDTCEELVTAATKHFEDNGKVSFLTMDIEKETWPEFINDYNIAYLDSTFEMMEDPLLLLKKLTKTFETVFFNRLKLFDLGEVEAEKGTYRWGGMEKDCSLWKLSELFFHNFSSSHGGDFKIIVSQSHGDGTATCVASYER
tara:strand:- start:3903 stop:4529 length:627 start_codon:yes stop_codon:yes gene_type:complete